MIGPIVRFIALAGSVAAVTASIGIGPIGLSAAFAQPQQSTYVPPLSDPALEARAKALQKELRCLVCQGQSIDESNADLAIDLKHLIREQIQSGWSDDKIKDFLVARYGAFVLMQPPVRQDTFLLWFGPALLVMVGGAIICVTVLKARKRLASDTAELDQPSQK